MPVSRQRHTKARRDRARVHHKLKPQKMTTCTNCQAKILPHTVCPKCGYYKGKEALNVMKKVAKKTKNKK